MHVPHVTHLFAAALCQAHGRANERGASGRGLRFPGSPARAGAHVATALIQPSCINSIVRSKES